jgi:hypothetical protein
LFAPREFTVLSTARQLALPDTEVDCHTYDFDRQHGVKSVARNAPTGFHPLPKNSGVATVSRASPDDATSL